MTTPLWCLLIVMVIPLLLAGMGGFFRVKQLGTVNNAEPREQAKELTGAGARAVAAQQNAWEALALFTAAVLTAHVLGADRKAGGGVRGVSRTARHLLCRRFRHDTFGDIPGSAGQRDLVVRAGSVTL